ncbi:MAG: sugar phosphate nucleotidyltransferase [bacterium]
MKVTKAVIPAAGMGTRMSPLTPAVPKELLPVGQLPMISYAISEAAAAGIDDIFIIIHKEKEAIRQFCSQTLWHNENLHLQFVYQSNPLGVMDAIFRVRDAIQGEPFLLLMPDNVYFDATSSVENLLNVFEEYRQSVLALIEVKEETKELFSNSGNVDVREIKNDLFRITGLKDKTRDTFHLTRTASGLRACGRALLTGGFFDFADEIETDILQNKDEVPVLQKMVQHGKVLGVRLKGRLFDCGHWQGYGAANEFCRLNNSQHDEAANY